MITKIKKKTNESNNNEINENKKNNIIKQYFINNFTSIKNHKISFIFSLLLSFIVIFFSIVMYFSIDWIINTVGNFTIEQALFHLFVPIQGTSESIITSFIKNVIISTLIYAIPIAIVIRLIIYKKIPRRIILLLIFLTGFSYFVYKINLDKFAYNFIVSSDIIVKNYVDPRKTNINANDNTNNLIYIFVESMESTYTSRDNGGIYEYDLIPELSKLANENISFSQNDKLGGPINFTGVNWTIAGMVAQTAGIPLKINAIENDFTGYDTFLPGVYSIGEILEDNGYKNYLMIGSEAKFGGRDNYFSQHGNYEIFDLNTAIETGKMKKEDEVWWGFDDEHLIKYAKEKLLEISSKGEKFNFTMLTVDTHFPDGYICNQCDNKYNEQYSNVIACSSKQLSKFVEWIKEQDFYDNTTIILVGDHITMQESISKDVKNNIGSEYLRSTYNVIINPSKAIDISNLNTKNRYISSLDMFPTTIAALGFNIDGNKLGNGTNLFSNEKTLVEKYGLDKFIAEMERRATMYNIKFVRGK